MMNLFVILIVSVIVMQDTEVLKGLKDWIIGRQWEEGKVAIPLSIIIGLIGGLTLGLGITDSILKALTIEYTLPTYYTYFDLISTSLIISKGSGFIIDTFEKVKEARVKVDSEKNV